MMTIGQLLGQNTVETLTFLATVGVPAVALWLVQQIWRMSRRITYAFRYRKNPTLVLPAFGKTRGITVLMRNGNWNPPDSANSTYKYHVGKRMQLSHYQPGGSTNDVRVSGEWHGRFEDLEVRVKEERSPSMCAPEHQTAFQQLKNMWFRLT